MCGEREDFEEEGERERERDLEKFTKEKPIHGFKILHNFFFFVRMFTNHFFWKLLPLGVSAWCQLGWNMHRFWFRVFIN